MGGEGKTMSGGSRGCHHSPEAEAFVVATQLKGEFTLTK